MRTGDGLPAMTLCNGRALPVVTVLLRAIVACGVVLALVRLWLGITSLHGGLAFWATPILLSGFGFVVARWWALLLPPVLAIALPWYELRTGYLAFRSAEDSPGWTLLVMLSSLLCVALGVALSHGLSAVMRPLSLRSALYRDGIALVLWLFCVLSAVMPPWHAGVSLLDPRPIARLGPPRWSRPLSCAPALPASPMASMACRIAWKRRAVPPAPSLGMRAAIASQ